MRRREQWIKHMNATATCPPSKPEQKSFKPKNPEVPKLDDYHKNAPDWYWQLFLRNDRKGTDPKIDPVKLRELAIECGYSDMAHLDKVCKYLEEGVKIGCHGKYRKPTIAKNSSSCFEDGYKISDAVASWVKKGVVHGPVDLIL